MNPKVDLAAIARALKKCNVTVTVEPPHKKLLLSEAVEARQKQRVAEFRAVAPRLGRPFKVRAVLNLTKHSKTSIRTYLNQMVRSGEVLLVSNGSGSKGAASLYEYRGVAQVK
jgi:hypothetical protein